MLLDTLCINKQGKNNLGIVVKWTEQKIDNQILNHTKFEAAVGSLPFFFFFYLLIGDNIKRKAK